MCLAHHRFSVATNLFLLQRFLCSAVCQALCKVLGTVPGTVQGSGSAVVNRMEGSVCFERGVEDNKIVILCEADECIREMPGCTQGEAHSLPTLLKDAVL